MTPSTVAHQALLSMEFSRQDYWSGLPFLSPGDLPDPGIKPGFLPCRLFTVWATKEFQVALVVKNPPANAGDTRDKSSVTGSRRSPGGRNDAKDETPVLWPPHAKSWRTGKDSDAGREWGQEKKGMTEDEMAGWHHWLDGRESEWTLGVGDGQGGLACCDSWGHKELDTTEWPNLTELKLFYSL